MVEKTVTIRNPKGIHARPAALIARTAARFTSLVTLDKDTEVVQATNVLGILMLCIPVGSILTVRADGPDESDALDAVVASMDARFDT